MPSVLKSASLQITRSCWQGIDAQITQIKASFEQGEASKGSKRLTSPTPNVGQGAHGSYKINQKPGYIHNLCDPPVFAPSTTSMFILLLWHTTMLYIYVPLSSIVLVLMHGKS